MHNVRNFNPEAVNEDDCDHFYSGDTSLFCQEAGAYAHACSILTAAHVVGVCKNVVRLKYKWRLYDARIVIGCDKIPCGERLGQDIYFSAFSGSPENEDAKNLQGQVLGCSSGDWEGCCHACANGLMELNKLFEGYQCQTAGGNTAYLNGCGRSNSCNALPTCANTRILGGHDNTGPQAFDAELDCGDQQCCVRCANELQGRNQLSPGWNCDHVSSNNKRILLGCAKVSGQRCEVDAATKRVLEIQEFQTIVESDEAWWYYT
jgi:hypothetical protein